jgi:hypothetical protein
VKRAVLLALVACHTREVAPHAAPAPVPAVSTSTPTAPVASVEPDAAGPDLRARRLAVITEIYAGHAATDALELPNLRIPYDDGKTKTTQERIDAPDIEDIFALGYPRGAITPVTDPEQDPGRVRIEALFAATYGADAKAVSAALVPVKLAGHTVSFHRRAAPALERVAKRIEPLLATEARFFKELGGTFNARNIAGTSHASAHTWGIAIDIDPAFSDYWRNMPPPPKWKNRVPQSIVDAFEAEGFAWGGRWFHYDTMHFEYRPELFDARAIDGRLTEQ